MICSAQLDTISLHFAHHPTALTDGSCNVSTLSRQYDPRNCHPSLEDYSSASETTDARLGTSVLKTINYLIVVPHEEMSGKSWISGG